MKNVSCEYDRLNEWNSTLQAAWYIRHVRWACLLYISFIMWCLWTTVNLRYGYIYVVYICRAHAAVLLCILGVCQSCRWHTNIPGINQAGGDFEFSRHETTICTHSWYVHTFRLGYGCSHRYQPFEYGRLPLLWVIWYDMNMCVFFTLKRSYPSTSSTPSVRADSSS